MHLPASYKTSRLPKQFPVGTTYVVEGCRGGDGHLRVFSRHVVLPDGQRINIADDFSGPASSRLRVRPRDLRDAQVRRAGKQRAARPKKNMTRAGTPCRDRG
jgi:hypothetical protein